MALHIHMVERGLVQTAQSQDSELWILHAAREVSEIILVLAHTRTMWLEYD